MWWGGAFEKLCLTKDRVRHFPSYGSCLRASPNVYKRQVNGQIRLFVFLGAKGGWGEFLHPLLIEMNFIVNKKTLM